MNAELITKFICELYKSTDFIPLHAPIFGGNEKKYVLETIDSTFVSSVGKFVDQFEKEIELFTGSARAVAIVNGTAALHAALYVAGVKRNDLVITQALTFVATGNVIHHMGAEPVFLDVSEKIKMAVKFGKKTKARNKIQHLELNNIAEQIISLYLSIIKEDLKDDT